MKSQVLIIFLLVMAILPMVSAYDSLGTFKQYDCVRLAQTCSNCTFVNISSVIYPDSIQALGQVAMTKSGTSYNYTMCGKANMTGDYLVNGFGDLDGKNEVFTYSFTVTPTGGAESNTIFLLIFLLIATGILLLGYLFHESTFAIIAGFAFLGAGVYSMIYGFGNIANVYTRMISLVIIGFGMVLSITSVLSLLEGMSGEKGRSDDGEDSEG